MRLKFAFEPIIGGVWGDEPKSDAHDMVCVRVADFNDLAGTVSTEKLTQRNISPSEQKGRVLRRGDLLLEKSGGGEQTAVGRSVRFDHDFKAVSSNFIALLRPHKAHDAKFLTYLMRATYHGGGSIPHIKQTTGIQNLDCSSYLGQDFNFPKLAEQRRIANYLDVATGKIDRLVGLRRRQMELLKEQRAALIQQAVTRGLDPNVPLKDSGIPWLGKIPGHWRELRIAIAVEKNTNGFVGPTRDILVEDGVRYLQSLHLKSGEIRFDKPYYVTEEWSRAHSKSILQEGDVLVVQTGDIGQVAAVPEEFEGCNCHALIILRMRRAYGCGKYLALLFNAHLGKNALMRETTGALLPHLECGKIRDIRLPFPPPEEQESILEFVQKENHRFDRLFSAYSRQIEMLGEYRAALIHEAVTGQKAV